MDPRRMVKAKKVKSGCRTCKIRKVKCDEGRPACQRCVATGRVCDGYGIWGGGSHHQRCARDKQVPRSLSASLIAVSGTEERVHFEWFKCRTATKLQGSFNSYFWSTLLFQASFSEPAVLHAVLALSSVHKRGICYPDIRELRGGGNIPDQHEQFTLEQYAKAISHLQPHFSSNDRASRRIALMACILFVSLDLLRGHFTTAQIHLQNGLGILQEMQMLLSTDDAVQPHNSYRESTDDWVMEAFSRLHLQLELFKYTHAHTVRVLPILEAPPHKIESVNDAWNLLQQAFDDIFHLAHQARQQVGHAWCNDEQMRIGAELGRWLDMFVAFRKRLRHPTLVEQKCNHLLDVYHTLAGIMNDTCLSVSGDEMIYDLHTDQFTTLLTKLEGLWTVSSTSYISHILPGYWVDMSKSVIDVGWIPPLYYIAIKCRVHQIRLQAIRLLERAFHREGIWDSKSAACVARKVMEMEEGNFYRGMGAKDTFGRCDGSSLEENVSLPLPTLPEACRMREVEVVFAGSPLDRISLYCKQRDMDQDYRVLLSVYDVNKGLWTDGI
ncbi:hypothetical protein BGZ63DRAFT_426907 [Mariannaea sp. PMI_226]|nr:hypothetical protein BGZ63DRAFT_426907 [Mariannaea sp. PMI_226]